MSETTSTIRRLLTDIACAESSAGGERAGFWQVAKYLGKNERVIDFWASGSRVPNEYNRDLIECVAFNPSLAEDREARVQHYIKLVEERGWIFDPPVGEA